MSWTSNEGSFVYLCIIVTEKWVELCKTGQIESCTFAHTLYKAMSIQLKHFLIKSIHQKTQLITVLTVLVILLCLDETNSCHALMP